MRRSSKNSRGRSTRFRPLGEGLEARELLNGSWPTYISKAELRALLNEPKGFPAVRPNTPVLPYGTPSNAATYIDPSARIANGYAVIVSQASFIGPYSGLDAQGGIIKVGGGTAILDNASIIANPSRSKARPVPEVLIGNQVQIGYGATILGPATIGGYGEATKAVSIGAGAIIDGATIEPGAFVSTLARVGPGVTVPDGMKILPGANVTTTAEATDPALGKAAPVTADDLAELSRTLPANLDLAAGYATLYQGQSHTGRSLGVPERISGVFNGDLSQVTGSSPEPGPASTKFLPPGAAPKFPLPHRGLGQGRFADFPARVTGGALFHQRARDVVGAVGRGNSFRADQGQPITVNSINRTGAGVTINSPDGGKLSIGQRFTAGPGAVILGGPANTTSTLGDDVTISAGAVVSGSSLGSGSTVGELALLLNSTFPDGTYIPSRAIYINNVLVGYVER